MKVPGFFDRLNPPTVAKVGAVLVDVGPMFDWRVMPGGTIMNAWPMFVCWGERGAGVAHIPLSKEQGEILASEALARLTHRWDRAIFHVTIVTDEGRVNAKAG